MKFTSQVSFFFFSVNYIAGYVAGFPLHNFFFFFIIQYIVV